MMKKSKIIKNFSKLIVIMLSFGIFAMILDLYQAKITFKEEISDLTSIKFYDNQNKLFYEMHNNHESTTVKIDEISEAAIKTFINIEDTRFYQHHGFDIYRIFQAFIHNLRNDNLIGASTITQQYVKNIYLSNQKSYLRKTREIYYAIKLEKIFDKKEILEGYLNSIYFNHGIYGIYDASKYYFNIEPKNLSYAQAAILVAIIKAPNKYAPDINYEKNLERKNIILDTLYKNNIISKNEYNNALKEKIIITKTPYQKYSDLVLYYKDLVLEEIARLKIKSKQLDIYTAFDSELNNYLTSLTKNINIQSNLSLVIQNNKGQIMAILGDKFYTGYNIATKGSRQIASTIKPMLYYEAIQNGFTPLTSFTSKKETLYLNHTAYNFQNFHNLYTNKKITLAYAIATSDNIYAVKTNLFLSSKKLISFLKKFNIKDVENYPSLALGTVEMSLLKLTSIYNTFSTLGTYYEPSVIDKIISDKQIKYQRTIQGKKVLNSSSCYILNELMTGLFDVNLSNVNRVTGENIADKLKIKCSAKTGSSDYDAYIVGFNPHYTVGIWCGNINNTLLSDYQAISYPKQLFYKSMNFLANDNKNIWYQKPNDVYLEFVDPTGFNTGYKKMLPFKTN